MLTRRGLLAAGGAAAIAPVASRALGQIPGRPARSALRVAFLTDFHLPAGGHNDDFRRAVSIAQDRFHAEMIIFGGDNVYSAETGPRENAAAQLENWQRLVGDHVHVGRMSILGNHDCWGLARGGKEFESGRAAAMRAYGMPGRYYAFEREGWRFIALDTIHPHSGTGYAAFVDDEQMLWMQAQLAVPKPTVIIGHAPALSGAAMMSAEAIHKGGMLRVSEARVLANGREVVEMLRLHPHVRMYLSGHVHMVDRVRYHRVDHIGAGAVCGGWWRGTYEHFGPTMAIVDLFSDGRAVAFTIPIEFPNYPKGDMKLGAILSALGRTPAKPVPAQKPAGTKRPPLRRRKG